MPPKVGALVFLLIGVGVASGTRTEDCRATCHQTCDKTCKEKEGKQLVVLGYQNPTYYKSWAEAREACKKKGGDLAMKLTEKDMKFVFGSLWSKLFNGRGQKIVWVGGLMNEHANPDNYMDSYEWLDGTPIPRDYAFWEVGWPYKWWGEPRCVILLAYRNRKGAGGKGPALKTNYCKKTEYSSPKNAALCEIPNQRHKYFAVNPDW